MQKPGFPTVEWPVWVRRLCPYSFQHSPAASEEQEMSVCWVCLINFGVCCTPIQILCICSTKYRASDRKEQSTFTLRRSTIVRGSVIVLGPVSAPPFLPCWLSSHALMPWSWGGYFNGRCWMWWYVHLPGRKKGKWESCFSRQNVSLLTEGKSFILSHYGHHPTTLGGQEKWPITIHPSEVKQIIIHSGYSSSSSYGISIRAEIGWGPNRRQKAHGEWLSPVTE